MKYSEPVQNKEKWIKERLSQVKDDLEKSEYKLKEFRESNRRIVDSPQFTLKRCIWGLLLSSGCPRYQRKWLFSEGRENREQ